MFLGIISGVIAYTILEILRMKYVSLSYLCFKNTEKKLFDEFYNDIFLHIEKSVANGEYSVRIELSDEIMSSKILKLAFEQLKLENFDVEMLSDGLFISWKK